MNGLPGFLSVRISLTRCLQFIATIIHAELVAAMITHDQPSGPESQVLPARKKKGCSNQKPFLVHVPRSGT